MSTEEHKKFSMNDETLMVTSNLTHVLFDCLANAGELDLANMVNKILEKLEAEITLRGGRRMLLSEKAVFAMFCPKFRGKGQ
jgi:hypothetical protein